MKDRSEAFDAAASTADVEAMLVALFERPEGVR